jgi:hypothetical protein
VSEHEHTWRKVPTVIVVVNDLLADVKGGETYNARCATCGEQAWLHWPSGSVAEAKIGRSVARPPLTL